MANGSRPGPERSPKISFRHDLPSSVVVFLVALPLCMGVAIASGAPVSAGLITGIVGGLIVAPLAGAPLQVSGPAAGLTVIVYEIIQVHGLPVMGIIILLAGLMQVGAGFLKLGQWFRAVSPAVIQGMLSGIGVLIFASQFHVMVDDKPRESGIANLLSLPEAVVKGLPLPPNIPAEARQRQVEQLKQLGQLHELQVELFEAIDESVSRLGNEELLRKEGDQLPDFAPRQQVVIEGFMALAPQLSATTIVSGDEAHQAEQRDIDQAVAALQAALVDLEGKHAEQAVDSQTAAVKSLEQLMEGRANHEWAGKIGIVTIALLVLWQLFPNRMLTRIPGPLAAVTVAAAGAFVWQLPVLYVELPERLTDGIHYPTWLILSELNWSVVLKSAAVVAFIATAETLLCATAVDQMHTGPRTKYDRELVAQGVGNAVCGALGALPLTGVIVRSAANVQAGGRTRAAAFFHGLWILIFVAVLGGVLRLIPTSCLAAILVYTGYKLVNFRAIRTLSQFGKSEVVIYLITVCTIVGVDLLTGVIVGVVLSALKLLWLFTTLKTHLELPDDGRQAKLSIEGAATFVRLPQLAAELERVPSSCQLRVDFSRLDYIDHACLDLLMSWAKQHESSGGELVLDWDSLVAKFQAEEPTMPAKRPTSRELLRSAGGSH